ncbi:MAG: hypothetical protein HRU19_05610 [Pseudobacteriovorax sp.]|nr:hypothetical protein [Pseudobacteriovorax sp.]
MKVCKSSVLAVLLAFGLQSCVQDPPAHKETEQLVSTSDKHAGSNSAGNLLATAIQKTENIDIVFVPSSVLADDQFALLTPEMSEEDVEDRIMRLYNKSSTDMTFIAGTMRGRDISRFVRARTIETLRHDLHVAGMTYAIELEGGIPRVESFRLEGGNRIEPNGVYRVAVQENAYRGVFPGYYFRQGLNRSFREERDSFSAADSLKAYLKSVKNLTKYSEFRSEVTLQNNGTVEGITAISQIQGNRHMSPYLGKSVTVRGVVTTVGSDNEGNREGVLEGYIQSLDPDDSPLTSEGIYFDLEGQDSVSVAVGDIVTISGIVYEDVVSEALTRTGIRQVSSVAIESSGNKLPEPFLVGDGDVRVPNKVISSWYGDLNEKPFLNLEDGIDFWESLEGMYVKVVKPVVVGFAGGRKDYNPNPRPKGYINVFIAADRSRSLEQVTPQPNRQSETASLLPYNQDVKGGLIIDNIKDDYNPEIIRVIDHHLAPNVRSSYLYNVGDSIGYDVLGVIGYNVNLFGSGEYVLYVTGDFSGTVSKEDYKPVDPNDCNLDGLPDTQEELDVLGVCKFDFQYQLAKPATTLRPEDGKLTVATFNVENLSGSEASAGGKDYRFENFARSIEQKLSCPDIINLVEIQDNDGPLDRNPLAGEDQKTGDADASLTLQRLIDKIKHCPHPAEYKPINVDPFENAEGGQPGGNIRVAMIYNSLRVGFTPRGTPTATSQTYLDRDNSLVFNPGRVFPFDERLKGTRKPIAAEFTFQGEKVFVIGNHFNSKGGDTSLWSAAQPPVLRSEDRRSNIAATVNDFTSLILQRIPDANIIVTGDFNDFDNSRALNRLEGSTMKNLANYVADDGFALIKKNDQYTYNFGGNSQPLDFILVSENMLKKSPELAILHINSDYMLQISDHDPVVSRFDFSK